MPRRESCCGSAASGICIVSKGILVSLKKMNDLMTKSFLSYVDLKKQAMIDSESGPDIEMGQLDPADERNLTQFFDEVGAIKADMDEITHLLGDLQDLNDETKSAHSPNVLRGLRDRINSDMVAVLRKAKVIKGKLELLDQSNVANRYESDAYKKGSPIDRTRISVTNGLRIKLRDMMNDFQSLREKIIADHKEGLKKRYYSATGEQPSEEVMEKMISGNLQVSVFEGKTEMMMENQERHEAVKELQKSLTELHQVFLDMAVMIETQGEQMNDIEHNMVNARSYVTDAMKELERSKKMKRRNSCACWIGIVVIVMILICVIAILF